MSTATTEGRSATRPRWSAVLLAVVALAGCFTYAFFTGRASEVPHSSGTTLVTYVHEGGFAGGAEP